MSQDLVINGVTYNGVESLEMKTTDGKKVLYFEGQPVKVVQETGSDETAVMSQKAVTNALNTLSNEIVDLKERGLSLGIASDGLIYLFVDGSPVGTGIPQGTGETGDLLGYVDENNTVVLRGELADGSYSIKYEMEDGSTINIGNLVLDSNVYYSVKNTLTNCTTNNSATQAIQGESYSATITAKSGYELSSVVVTMGGSPVTVSGGVINIANVTGNIVITAVAEEIVAKYTNILTSGAYEVQLNKRWSNSSKGYSGCNGMIAFTIPKADVWGKTIWFKGFPANTSAGSNVPLWMTIDATNSRVSNLTGTTSGTGNVWDSTHLNSHGNGVYSLAIDTTTFEGSASSVAKLAINMAFGSTAISAIPADAIMTIDEPIE